MSKFERSAGVIVYRVEAGKRLYLLLDYGKHWEYPKGHIEKGENAPEAALREVEEETGYLCEIIKPFDKVQYWFKRGGQLIKKTVTWFLMKPIKKTGTYDAEEILETRWVPIEEALTLARYKSDKQLLNKLTRV